MVVVADMVDTVVDSAVAQSAAVAVVDSTAAARPAAVADAAN
jgi:hypothetical protein